MLEQAGCRPDRARHQIAAAIGANAQQHRIGAIGTKRAFKAANARIKRISRQIAITAFAVGAQLQHQGIFHHEWLQNSINNSREQISPAEGQKEGDVTAPLA
jgi:hypothetical protein